ncbi:MAG: hypothetical protein PVH88_12315 [Ignavibacteria bacterium]|jgi:hypothetical protein
MTEINISTSDADKHKTLNSILSNAIERERLILLSAIEKTKFRLTEFEKRNSVSSDRFFENYTNGTAGDSDEVIDWAGEYQIYLNLKKKLDSLKDVVVAH